MKYLTILLAAGFCSCVNPRKVPEGTSITIGGKNPVTADLGGKSWKQAFAEALKVAGEAAARVGVQLVTTYATTALESKLFPNGRPLPRSIK